MRLGIVDKVEQLAQKAESTSHDTSAAATSSSVSAPIDILAVGNTQEPMDAEPSPPTTIEPPPTTKTSTSTPAIPDALRPLTSSSLAAATTPAERSGQSTPSMSLVSDLSDAPSQRQRVQELAKELWTTYLCETHRKPREPFVRLRDLSANLQRCVAQCSRDQSNFKLAAEVSIEQNLVGTLNWFAAA